MKKKKNLNIVIIYFMPTKNQRRLERKERDQVLVCFRKKYIFIGITFDSYIYNSGYL